MSPPDTYSFPHLVVAAWKGNIYSGSKLPEQLPEGARTMGAEGKASPCHTQGSNFRFAEWELPLDSYDLWTHNVTLP